MNVGFSDEELLLHESVLSQARELGFDRVEALDDYDDERLWGSLAASDVLGLGLPESFGGFGTLADAAIVAMALGRSLAPAPYLGCAILPTQLLASTGVGGDVTADVVAGRRRLAVGIDPTTLGVATESSYEALAWDSAGADAALVLDGDRSGRLVAVALKDPTPGLDLTRAVRRCDLGRRVPIAGLDDRATHIGDVGLARWEALALALVSADIVGVMEGALELGVGHVMARHQFGVALGTFQALQHLLAEQHVSFEGARATAVYAAWTIDHRPGQATLASHTAKAYGSEHGKRLCEAIIQVHGGMGVTWECLAHVFLKRLLFDRAFLGDERRHLRRIAAIQRTADNQR